MPLTLKTPPTSASFANVKFPRPQGSAVGLTALAIRPPAELASVSIPSSCKTEFAHDVMAVGKF